ncbi:MAG: 30S ribosomal protein S9 [Saprospiraceae bacterium]|jgi:small subunit ribosomal protein S9|nr:30S ribosomal protein S9 [Saprospiraceae bacterium]MBK6480762.1 30S ribosomal protein S9 [Saprospiraceae bacterium]MBK6816880.1 30S ribosomal protein S9 [Saprospiraceae bacterium]MBK7371408.1 30S ribosomal protein S9 [Saprospiraceae bacterium]MBK7436097.1 30S ribosomal protein S9 [Saprospiraceae bacterium]
MEIINGVGRRKAAVARVYIYKGAGQIRVNGRELADYFPLRNMQAKLMEPFLAAKVEQVGYDMKILVSGGGFKGQAEAIRLGISRCLVKINGDYKKPLKDLKLLTRDARVVERKKYGKPKARKSFQFSKR